jgi:hypothetical protein
MTAEMMNSTHNKIDSVANITDDESLRPSPDSTPPSVVGDTSSSTAKRVSAPETPRWRFVNKAKKTEGYSSSAAGRFVQGE